MAEFIITSKQLKKMLDAVSNYLMVGVLMGYDPSRPVNEVVISGEELPVLVHCRDCESWSGPCCGDHEQGTCSGWSAASGTTLIVTKADDFCSYGARREEER